MSAQPFKPISWSPGDPVTVSRLQNMADNDQWLMDNKVQGYYNAFSIQSTATLKLAAGLALITASPKNTADAQVRFNDFFTPASRPLITTGTVANAQRRLTITLSGYGTLHPDHRGFNIWVFADADIVSRKRILNNFYVAWHALGY